MASPDEHPNEYLILAFNEHGDFFDYLHKRKFDLPFRGVFDVYQLEYIAAAEDLGYNHKHVHVCDAMTRFIENITSA